jgi:hypothetical protein
MDRMGEANSEQLAERLVQRLDHWRLALPALAVLEAARPFSFIASQGLLLCQPLLSFFYDGSQIAGYADLLADRSNLEYLISQLESRRTVPNREGKEREG